MKKAKLIFAALLASVFFFTSCEEEIAPLSIVSIEATGTDVESGEPVTVDLNAATAPANVPVDPTVTITFSKDVSVETVNNTSIQLLANGNPVATTISVIGAVVTMELDADLERGTDYSLSLGSAIQSTDGGTFATATRSFTTGGRATVVPPNADDQIVYWNFDGDANDQVGSNNPTAEIAITYDTDRFGQAASAAYFDGDASIIEYPNGSSMINTEDFTISFWLRTDSEGHVNANGDPTGMFVFGLGAFFGIQYEIFGDFSGSKFAIGYANDAGDQFGEDMWFPSQATDNSSGGWQGWTYANFLEVEQMQAIIKDRWYHVIYTFNSEERTGTLYFDGVRMKEFDFDLWPDGAPKQTANRLEYRGQEPDVLDEFALGFIHSRGGTLWDSEPWGGYEFPTANHYKGWLDDFRIFHAAFTQQQVEALHDAEKP